MMKKLFRGLEKTRNRFIDPLKNLFSSGDIGEETVEKMEELLFSADLGYDATGQIVETLREGKWKGREDAVLEALRGQLLDIMSEVPGYEPPQGSPRVIVIVGVNGVGKTSTIGKLAHYFRERDKDVLLAACDTFRAAAIEQLELWADRCGVPVVRSRMGADPASVAFDAVSSARSRGSDTVIIDTAGRLHTKVNLMKELEKIFRVLSTRHSGIGLESWLVIDANSGQNSIKQAEVFVQTLPVSGMVVTKLDSTSKAGVIIPIQKQLRLPVLFAGVGETVSDLEPFDREQFVSALLGK
ncbi:MAG: signal recognition particle-docking protein FtsY [Candidatus Latescibacteria bacterium]|nr:signal recognition particle-docking protein FtsY [bacterium]MBD3425577.1 signal recognition particle-docking protein FtsY [Candidatus Latescibacterota bacterium]